MATDRHQAPSYPLRMPDELKSKVQQAAADAGRSLHAEVLYRLERSFAEQDALLLARTIARLELALANRDLELATSQGALVFLSSWLVRLLNDEKISDQEKADILAKAKKVAARKDENDRDVRRLMDDVIAQVKRLPPSDRWIYSPSNEPGALDTEVVLRRKLAP